MQFDINIEEKYKIDSKLFSDYDKNGVSYYDINKIKIKFFTISEKSIKNIQAWIKKHEVEKYKATDTNIFNIIKISDDSKVLITSTQKTIWDIIKIMLLLYCDSENRNKSIISQFRDIYNIKFELVAIVKLKTLEHSATQLKIIKYTFNNKEYDNISKVYLDTIRYKYPKNVKLNKCYIYSYYNLDDRIELIIYPEKITTLNEMQYIVELLYLRTINIKKKYKLFLEQEYYYVIELCILLDIESEKLTKIQNYMILDPNLNKQKIEYQLNTIGYTPYEKIQDFARILQKLNSKTNIQIEKKRINNTKKNVIKSPTIIKEKIVKKYDENNSTIYSDSDESESNTKSPVIQNKTDNSIKIKKSDDKQDILNKSIRQYIKNNLKRKKGDYMRIQTILENYKISDEYKTISNNIKNITRTKLMDCLTKYKWFNDNFKLKHKEIRSVLLNYTL
jgi:hypothetical protein